MKRLIAHVSGKVKGVGYSSIVVTLAGTLDLKGYIEMLPDGKAFIIAEGPKVDLVRFVRAIRIDNAKIGVKAIMIDCREPTGEFNDFREILPRQEEQIHPFKDAQKMADNFLQAPAKMERLDHEICTPNHKLNWTGSGLERQEDAIELSQEEIADQGSDRSLQKLHRKLSLNK
jgi:acylphosphatase